MCLSLALVATAIVYMQLHPLDRWLLTAALPACLLEGWFYLAATLSSPRGAFAKIPVSTAKAALLWVSSLLPYLVFSLLAGTFNGHAFSLLAALTAVLCFWHVLAPRRVIYDLAFLVVAAAPIIARVFRRLYISPDPHLSVDVLGHVMWLRSGIVALLVLRGWDPGAFGLWPHWREWKAGALYFLLSIGPIALLSTALHDTHFALPAKGLGPTILLAAGTFFGILWVVALGEELFFRGFIARAIDESWHSSLAAVLISAILYGTSHLWFHAFPNWRRAVVATALGLVCGVLYLRSGSVRAAMVTHSFTVAAWRVFFWQ